MFGKDSQDRTEAVRRTDAASTETVIGASVKVEGDFVSEGDILVRGVVKGSVKTLGNLRVEEKAKINANIEAANAFVGGNVKGNIMVNDSLEIGKAAVVVGDISAKVLSIAPGAKLNGHCSVATEQHAESAEPTPRSAAASAAKAKQAA